jgi:arylsulfatase A-like enzyme
MLGRDFHLPSALTAVRSRRSAALAGALALAAIGVWRFNPLQGPVANIDDLPPPNFLIIDIDTLRYDRVGAGIAPRLDDLAQRSVRFTRAISAAGWTMPAFAALLAGRYPPQDLMETGAEQTSLDRLLPSILRVYGYHVGVAWGGTLLSGHPNSSKWFGADPMLLDSIDNVAANLDKLPEPFFVLTHDIDLNEPLGHGKPNLRELWTKSGNQETTLKTYDSALAAYDRRLGALLDALDRSERRDRTVLILLSDHGNEFWEHGDMGHSVDLWNEVVRVPLLVLDPAEGGRSFDVKTLVQNTDVAPTVLARAHIPIHAEMCSRAGRFPTVPRSPSPTTTPRPWSPRSGN